jgi:hypothetical protein
MLGRSRLSRQALGPGQLKDAARVEGSRARWRRAVGGDDLVRHGRSRFARLLDKKFDPNSATTSGGTTALMLAMPDLEKATLLLDRGAKVNARSKSRYSALLVAAQYPNASPVIRKLLAGGAEIKLPKGAGSPMFGAFPAGAGHPSRGTRRF